MKTNINFRSKYLPLLIAFAFYLLITSRIPYMLDDWNWGIDAGIQSLLTADQNSRYSGNLVVVLLTRSTFLKTTVMAAVFAFIPYLMTKIVVAQDVRSFALVYILSNILLLCMPSSIWRQTYGWVSGFANFVVSAIPLCGHIILLRHIFLDQLNSFTLRKSKINTIMVFLFAFTGQLFIENLAVFFAAAYFFILIFCMMKKKVHFFFVAAFLGVCMGLLVMFSSSIYKTLLSTGTVHGGYRQLGFDMNGGILNILRAIVKNFCYQSVQQTTLEFYPQTILLLVSTTVLLLRSKSKFSKLLVLGNIGITAVYALVWGAEIFVPYRYKILFGLLYFVAMLVEFLYLFLPNREKCDVIVFTWLSLYGTVLPLAATTVADGRLLFAPYVLINIVVLMVVFEVLKQLPAQRILTVCACGIALLMAMHYLPVYRSIGNTNGTRLRQIDAAVTQNTGYMYLEEYDYPEYLWNQDPVSDNPKWERDFKKFYGIPEDYVIFIAD